MGNDGKVLEEVLDELGVKKGQLAKNLGKSSNTVTNWLKQSTIGNDKLIEIGKVLRFDLSHKFPRLKKVPEATDLNYFNEDPSEVLKELQEVRKAQTAHEQVLADKDLEIKFLKEKLQMKEELLQAKEAIIEGLRTQIEGVINK